MVKNNIAVILIAILGFAILAVGTSQIVGSQSFSLIQETVHIPQYFTGECVNRADHLAEISRPEHTDSPTWYHCDSQEAGKWIPDINGVQCEYITKGQASAVHVCDGFTENENDLPGLFGGGSPDCSDNLGQTQFTIDGEQRFTVNAGGSIYIDTSRPIGDAELSVKYPSFGLRLRSADGFVQSTSNDCLLNSLGSEFHTVDAGNRLEIIPDVPFNAVSALQPAISTQAVRLADVENNQPIYISRPGFYHLIKNAEDGFPYVDTTKEFNSNKIECIPRTTGCSDEAKIIQIEDQSCDKFGGSITNFAPVADDPTKLCKYSCSDGSLELTNDCIDVTASCPPETPLWDTTTGKCTRTVEEVRCPDGLPVGDRVFVKKDTKTCGGSLACQLGITEPEVSTESVCKVPSFFDEFGLLLVLLAGMGLVGLAIFINQQRKKNGKKR